MPQVGVLNLPKPERRSVAAWLWQRPHRRFLLGIPAGGLLAFIIGIAFAGCLFAALHYVSTDAFCTSCHEMNTPFQELTHSTHYANEAGMRANCADCHVPPGFLPGLMQHIAASVEVWGHLRGELNTPARYESHRLELAQKVWKGLKADDSVECRSCHSPAEMADAKEPTTADKVAAISPATMHQYLATSYTCIDCHKGSAHKLPSAG